jgi:hypothetical protein
VSAASHARQRAGSRTRLSDPMVGAVVALGITQITAWGTSYYCLGVLAGPISRNTGWSRGFVFLGFTVALLAMGLVSSTVGRAIDRHGGRAVMTFGTILVSVGLFALSHARSEAVYLIVWAFLGVGMRLCLYDAAFAAQVQSRRLAPRSSCAVARQGATAPEERGAWSRCPIDVVTIPLAVATMRRSGCSRWSHLDCAPHHGHPFCPRGQKSGPELESSHAPPAGRPRT